MQEISYISRYESILNSSDNFEIQKVTHFFEMPKFAFYCILVVLLLLQTFATIKSNPIEEENQEENKYDIKYDNIDIDELLKSDRLLTNYINCLMEEGPCTEDGRELKETLPDAITTDCSKCSEKQKVGSEKVMHYM